jgi:hypothetical protein
MSAYEGLSTPGGSELEGVRQLPFDPQRDQMMHGAHHQWGRRSDELNAAPASGTRRPDSHTGRRVTSLTLRRSLSDQ